MLKLLFGLSPPIVAIVFALIGTSVSGAAFALWNHWIDNPAIVRVQQAVCLAQVEKAAAEAVRLEEYRRYTAGRQAAEDFMRRQLELETNWQQAIEEAERDTERFRQLLQEKGGSCPVTADHLEYLTGVQHDRAPP